MRLRGIRGSTSTIYPDKIFPTMEGVWIDKSELGSIFIGSANANACIHILLSDEDAEAFAREILAKLGKE